MKKTALILAACLLAGLCTACGNTAEPSDAGSQAASSAETAAPADSSEPDSAETTAPAVSDALTFQVGEYHAKAGDKHFPVTIRLENSPGLSMIGLRVHYAEELSPCMEGNDKLKIEHENGPMSNTLVTTCAANVKDHLIGYAGFSSGTPEGTGELFTCYFDIPADAASGTKYEIRPEAVDIADTAKQKLTAENVTGYIIID